MKKLFALFPFLILGTIHGGGYLFFRTGCANNPKPSHAMAAAYIETILEKDPSLREKAWIQKAEDELVKKPVQFVDALLCGEAPRYVYEYHHRAALEELRGVPSAVLVKYAERDLQNNLTPEAIVGHAEALVAMAQSHAVAEQKHRLRCQSQLIHPCPSRNQE